MGCFPIKSDTTPVELAFGAVLLQSQIILRLYQSAVAQKRRNLLLGTFKIIDHSLTLRTTPPPGIVARSLLLTMVNCFVFPIYAD
jgi:hypothetical protein